MKILKILSILTISMVTTSAYAKSPTIDYKVIVIDGNTYMNGSDTIKNIVQKTQNPLTDKAREDVNVIRGDIEEVTNIITDELNNASISAKDFHNIRQGQGIHISYNKNPLHIKPKDTDDEFQYENKKMSYYASGRVHGALVNVTFNASLNGEKKQGTLDIPSGSTFIMPFHTDSTDKTYKEFILLMPTIQ
jgi:hypothetical protein